MIYNKYIELCMISIYVLKNLISFLVTKDAHTCIKNTCNDISKINIVYVKIFQSISINSALFDKTTREYLTQYTDKVPYTPDEIDHDALCHLKQFMEVGISPINSGIFALVYKGIYNKKPIAIKILKKDIHVKLQNCIKNLQILFYISSYIPIIKNMNLYEFLIQNKSHLVNQTCFHKESANLNHFKSALEENDRIVIPNIYDNFTQTNILVMDYIEGKTFAQIKKEDYLEYGKLLLNMYITKKGVNYYMHSDLHVGNLLFLENKICVLDFGVVIKIKETYQSMFFDLLYTSIMEQNYNYVYDNLNTFLSKKLDFSKITEKENAEIKTALYESSKKVFEEELDLIFLIHKINDIIKKYNIYIDVNIIEIAFSYSFIFNTLNELLGKSCIEVFKEEFKTIFNMVSLE